ncbi:UDP-N-acetylmuramate--L-alanine ligase [bacterium]|nr:MAG: UDP-N-acetylmuramate--L-alanine ligase [bacterium]
MFKKIKQLHFVGIGGSGMSGIAEILLNLGYKITGSDIKRTEVTERLEELGAEIKYYHSPDNVGNADVVVVSSAIKGDNPELIIASEMGIPIIRRAEMLAELMRLKYGIGIAGTHGKSTTTSLVGEILTEGQLDPTVIVGGIVANLRSNVRLGTGEYLVAEADEFDRSFLRLTPTIAVVTNMEKEHLECYDDKIEELRGAFLEFMNKVPFYGAVILCIDETPLQELLPEIERRVITYGLSTQADVRAVKVEFNRGGTTFTVVADNKTLGEIETSLIGLHNVRNILAAIAVSLEVGVNFEDIKRALANFKGVYRRFQIKGQENDILVVDDFGHHPTEIQVTLKAAKMAYNDMRIVAVFQPHLYSRTQEFFQEFGKAFLDCDVLVVTEIYGAREEPVEDVSGEMIVRAAKDYGHRAVFFEPETDKIPELLNKICNPGDLVLTIGAGPIWKVGTKFLEILRKNNKENQPSDDTQDNGDNQNETENVNPDIDRDNKLMTMTI